MMDKPFAITLNPGSSLANHTGSWRTTRPVYVDRLPPCNATCPAGENIQGWLLHAESGDYEKAWRALVANNPLPAIMGRACYHPCESACNRNRLDEAVGINSVERFLGDEAIRNGWKFDAPAASSGKKVLVIGAGPAGLSAAYHLQRLGHQAVIVDAAEHAGGMMRYGIPKYRLPRDIIDAEVQRILDLGVELRLNTKVANLADAMREGFDAAFLGVGAHIAKRAYIPAGDANKVLDAVAVLRGMEGEDSVGAPMLGRKVVVYGGGNTAIDVARTAKRLGAEEAIIVYRRTRDKMPAHDFEVEEALQEGISIKWLSTIKEAGLSDTGGDMAGVDRTVTVAVGHGKKAARAIDAWLRGEPYAPLPKPEIATIERMNSWYYSDAPKTMRPVLDIIRRQSTFEEVLGGLDEGNALFEARRCMSCGNCFECDNCYGVCPDNAVIKLGPGKRFKFNFDYCKGCGICATECPCGAIRMVAEEN